MTTGGAPWVLAPSELQQDRQRYRRHAARRSTLLSLASTLAFAAVLYLGVTSSPGWERTQEQFFDLEVARESLPHVLRGLWLNLRVLAVASVSVLVLGLAVALLRSLRGPVFLPVRLLATVYTDVFRGVPLIVLLLVIGFGVPGLRLQGVTSDVVVLGTVAIVLTYSAYVAEVFRAGIETVHPSQRAAARSLGLSHRQAMRLVILPQAVRRVTPPLLNDFVALQKDVGLISILGARDAIQNARIQVALHADFTPYVIAGLLFVLLAVPTARLADWASWRAARRQQAGGLV